MPRHTISASLPPHQERDAFRAVPRPDRRRIAGPTGNTQRRMNRPGMAACQHWLLAIGVVRRTHVSRCDGSGDAQHSRIEINPNHSASLARHALQRCAPRHRYRTRHRRRDRRGGVERAQQVSEPTLQTQPAPTHVRKFRARCLRPATVLAGSFHASTVTWGNGEATPFRIALEFSTLTIDRAVNSRTAIVDEYTLEKKIR